MTRLRRRLSGANDAGHSLVEVGIFLLLLAVAFAILVHAHVI